MLTVDIEQLAYHLDRMYQAKTQTDKCNVSNMNAPNEAKEEELINMKHSNKEYSEV